MRKEFSAWVKNALRLDSKMVFLTGDLGFSAFEEIAEEFGQRFINAGVAEQNMVAMAAGLAHQGLHPFCYSIAPFMVFRPAEQIRLDLCLHNMNVKIVGNGGGYGYGIMGATHHALEDLAFLSSLPNMKCYVPFCNEDVESVCNGMLLRSGPAYLRLGYGVLPKNMFLTQPHSALRHLQKGSRATVVGIGPVLLNALQALQGMPDMDVFAISELPLESLGALEESLGQSGRLIVVEEHGIRGGLAEHLSRLILERGILVKVCFVSSRGYPTKTYGSQAFHQRQSGLDSESLATLFKEFCL